jgi:hypothetical protein
MPRTRQTRRLALGAIAACVAALGAGPASAGAATLIGDYRFQDDLTNSVTTPGALPSILEVGTLTFQTRPVAGLNRRVLAWDAGEGLRIGTPGSDPIGNYVADDASWSVATLFKFDSISGYKRIYDTENLTSDNELYSYQGKLNYWNYSGDGPGTFFADQYVLVTQTYDQGTVKTYIESQPQFTVTDGGEGSLDDGALGFFKDNTSGGATGEQGPGAVARIRVWDGVLTADEVAALDDKGELPPLDAVNGTGEIGGGNEFVFNAISEPDGENPRGTIEFTAGSERIAGDVVCLDVNGSSATIIYEDTDPPAKTGGTVGGIVRVQSGTPDAQRNGRLALRKLRQYKTEGCDGVTGAALNPIISGDISVVDLP